MRYLFAILAILFVAQNQAHAQDLTFSTVSREPFSMLEGGTDGGAETGFSVDLIRALAKDLNKTVALDRKDSFTEMLDAVQASAVDGAIANISITAAREADMDFTLPIFASGVQVMLPADSARNALFTTILTREIGLAVVLAFGILFACGMIMWAFERNRQEYFDRPFYQALFPSFWWALNLVVNGGFEERMPRSPLGRGLGVVMVISSLFIVSIFVARITAALTVEAIQSNVQSLSDLDGRAVGTIERSTSAAFLDQRGISYVFYTDLDTMIAAFEAHTLQAVVFDGPILAYYVNNKGRGQSRLMDKVFKPENYGIALPTGSPLREEINQSLLRLRENGTYADLVRKWFGNAY